MSAYERPDLAALDELEQLVGRLGDELATWRKRCQAAEAELKSVRGGRAPAKAAAPSARGPELDASRDRVEALEAENAALQARIDSARARVQALASRLALTVRGTREGAA